MASPDLKPGDWVDIKPEHDTPPIFRPDGKPTRGRVADVDLHGTGEVEVWIPLSNDDGSPPDVDKHSQSVPYPPEALEKVVDEKAGHV